MKESTLKNIERALALKKEDLSMSEISIKMNRPVGTVKRWLAPYRLGKDSKAVQLGRQSRIDKFKKLRVDAYNSAKLLAGKELKDNKLRDFVNIYIGEGSKTTDSEISIVSSDPKIILMSLAIMKKYFLKEGKKLVFNLCYYKENNNEKELLEYWSKLVKDSQLIKLRTYVQPTVNALRHNNSNQYGLVTIKINDTYAKQKLNAYMDYLKNEWTKNFEESFETKFVEIQSGC